ncbi:MAG: T9SS C-terminal target domain-containing protein [Bacteroidetes bacterium]|nr:MAG: T9SS C-terminal target domain-containing protein [Bacteroidota bacterium]
MHKILLLTNLFLFFLYPSFAQNPLLIPPVLSGENIDLTIQEGSVEFFPGTSTATLGVNGNILGPTLILEKGQEVNITVNNLIGESTTIHWHGMHVSAVNDGGPHTVIEAEETWNPQFTVLDNAATYWYHPHLHEKTNDHVLQGIAGFIIVQDEEEGALDLPRTYGTNDFPIVIQTKTFDADKQIVLGANAMDTTVLVNATRNPYVDVPGEVVRLRLLNGASQRIFNLGFSNNQTFYQIGSDGGLLSQPIEMNRLMLSPGERAEILVNLNSSEGQNIFLKSFSSELPTGYYGAEQVGMNAQMTIPDYSSNPLNGADFNILQLNVQEPSGGVTTIPSELVSVTPWDQNDVDTTRNLLFTPETFGPSGMVNGPFVIDGNSFDLNVINQVIPLDNVEIWEITNQTMIAHPFHIHDVQFYLLTRNGVQVPENERGRKDVVLIPPQFGTIRFITKFEDFADDEVPYMYHCHMLTHEDEGMMGQFTVVDFTTGVHEFEEASISVYPNPASQSVTLKGLKSSVIELFNTSGQLLEHRETNNEVESIGLSHYSPGIYYLKVKGMDMNRTFKVIKN